MQQKAASLLRPELPRQEGGLHLQTQRAPRWGGGACLSSDQEFPELEAGASLLCGGLRFSIEGADFALLTRGTWVSIGLEQSFLERAGVLPPSP